YWIGQRHGLPQINIFDVSARMNESVPQRYRGLDRGEARAKVLDDLRAEGLLEKVVDHPNSVGRCYRCDTVIEPWLSDQWFVRMAPLAAPALAVVRDGLVRLHPERWTKVYEHWMTGIRDWCISRQLWWGHRIPVWYCASQGERTARCAEPIVSRSAPSSCPGCGATELRQDEDVLDTWFSSWLWPFSVHDWPAPAGSEAEADLRYFYPTDALVTAPEIIFFWVARMIMAGLKFGPTFTGTDEAARNIPFRDVYFTSTVRDAKGRKMSKSLGNSPEPLDLIARYGADAVRYTILNLAPVGQDVTYAQEKNELGRNFANKIWNAGRFLLMNRESLGGTGGAGEFSPAHADLADRWILSRLHSTLRDVEGAIGAFEFNRVTRLLYDFLWHDYCDWFLEMLKSRLYGGESAAIKQVVLARAIDVYDAALRLLHPVMPFVTEELWQALRARPAGATIMRERIPAADPALIDTAVERQMAFVQGLIEAVRAIRSEMSIPPSADVTLTVTAGAAHPAGALRAYEGYMQRLARVTQVTIARAGERPPLAASAIVEGEELFVPLAGLIDLDRERARLTKELERVEGMLRGIRAKLGSEAFTAKAPPDVVAREREKLASFEATREKLARNIAQISSGGRSGGAG
ncbi:MAG TPA: class I tRNA ligase family protein, partial [Bacteroidota bacterium]|nr:class I tRNA ligase family protein [Bacteroidota bacterium]